MDSVNIIAILLTRIVQVKSLTIQAQCCYRAGDICSVTRSLSEGQSHVWTLSYAFPSTCSLLFEVSQFLLVHAPIALNKRAV